MCLCEDAHCAPITTILGVYRGRTLADARLVAVSADPELVADVAARMLRAPGEQMDDPVVNGQREAERAALRVVKREAEAELETTVEHLELVAKGAYLPG